MKLCFWYAYLSRVLFEIQTKKCSRAGAGFALARVQPRPHLTNPDLVTDLSERFLRGLQGGARAVRRALRARPLPAHPAPESVHGKKVSLSLSRQRQLAGTFDSRRYAYLCVASPKRGSWGDLSSWSGLARHVVRADYGTFQLYSGDDSDAGGLLQRLRAYGAL